MITGVDRLALLGKHAEALMAGCARDEVPLERLSTTALNRLLTARILWRPGTSKAGSNWLLRCAI